MDIDPLGKVVAVRIVQSTPPGIFDTAAMKAAKVITYQPATQDGKAVATTIRETIHWVPE